MHLLIHGKARFRQQSVTSHADPSRANVTLCLKAIGASAHPEDFVRARQAVIDFPLALRAESYGHEDQAAHEGDEVNCTKGRTASGRLAGPA